jgi:hypothetical protein
MPSGSSNPGTSNTSSNPVRSSAHFNALSDKLQANIVDIENNFQREILGSDQFSSSKLRQDITETKTRLAYARMAADNAWQELGAEIKSRNNSDFMNLSKA